MTGNLDGLLGNSTNDNIGGLDQSLENQAIKKAINELLIMTSCAFILPMQLGFAYLETGLVRQKNSKHILIKNLFD